MYRDGLSVHGQTAQAETTILDSHMKDWQNPDKMGKIWE